jgi:hypothetical protein
MGSLVQTARIPGIKTTPSQIRISKLGGIGEDSNFIAVFEPIAAAPHTASLWVMVRLSARALSAAMCSEINAYGCVKTLLARLRLQNNGTVLSCDQTFTDVFG